jgi:hypothetical protein
MRQEEHFGLATLRTWTLKNNTINPHTSRVFPTTHSLAQLVAAATHAIADVPEGVPFVFTQPLTFLNYSCLKVIASVCVLRNEGC